LILAMNPPNNSSSGTPSDQAPSGGQAASLRQVAALLSQVTTILGQTEPSSHAAAFVTQAANLMQQLAPLFDQPVPVPGQPGALPNPATQGLNASVPGSSQTSSHAPVMPIAVQVAPVIIHGTSPLGPVMPLTIQTAPTTIQTVPVATQDASPLAEGASGADSGVEEGHLATIVRSRPLLNAEEQFDDLENEP
ncbi:hypothetical protein BGZ54_004412, partial [Gamsiella multidivaricata]